MQRGPFYNEKMPVPTGERQETGNKNCDKRPAQLPKKSREKTKIPGIMVSMHIISMLS
jgi:hypothetical protein